MLLQHRILLCFYLMFFSSAGSGLYSRKGLKPTTQSNVVSDTQKRSFWGTWLPDMKLSMPSLTMPWSFSAGAADTQITTTMENPTTEISPTSPYITTQGYTVSVEAQTNHIYQLTTTEPEGASTDPVLIGNPLPQRSTTPRGEQMKKPKPLSDPNYDLEFWPANRGRDAEVTPYTALPLSSTKESPTSSTQSKWTTTTSSVKIQTSEAKVAKNHQVTTTGLQTLASSEPIPMTTQPKGMWPTTTLQRADVSTSPPSKNTTENQPALTPATEDSINTERVTDENSVTSITVHWTLESEATEGAPDGFLWSVPTTSMAERESLGSAPNLTHMPLTTASSVRAGLEEEEKDVNTEEPTDLTEKTASRETSTTTNITTLKTTEIPATVSEDWLLDMTQESALPDCNAERSGVCNSSESWAPANPSDSRNNGTITITSTNQSQAPTLFPLPPMLVPLYSDWNSAMAAWGLGWEAHVYGLGSVFCLIALASALNLLCLPLCCPSGCGYFALVSLFLLAAGCTRAFALLYDAYGYQDHMASAEAALLLYEAPFPCMTAAFGLVFLLLSMRSRMQLSYSAFQRPCFLACLVLLHFAAAFGPVALLRVDQEGAPLCLFLSLISRGAFVALATFLSVAYFVFYCYVRADSKHIYHLNNTSPTPAERYNRCPFAESQDWNRAAAAVFLSAIFCLACAGLQLYAMLHALGFAGNGEGFRPWPWWAFQLSCRVCEAVVFLMLALVVSQPVYCSDHLPQPGSCWMELLAAKSPIIPGSYQWTLTQQEKLAICDPIGHGEIECLPLYTLVDDRMGSLNGLDLLYHSNRALAYRDLDLDLPDTLPNTGAPSVGSSCTSDSTADLRPPSPINLRRSIDEALFSEALFPMSLFSPVRPFTSSDHSLDGRDTGSSSAQTLRYIQPPDPGLYRTSSCVDVLPDAPLPTQEKQDTASLGLPPSPSPSPSSSSCSSSERWRGSSSCCSLYRPSLAGSSLVLCSSPEGHNPLSSSTISCSSGCTATTSHQGVSQQRHYRTSNSQGSLDQQCETDQSVQEEFISVCRQIDALSVCSETIDL